jgi:hypothetical protein
MEVCWRGDGAVLVVSFGRPEDARYHARCGAVCHCRFGVFGSDQKYVFARVRGITASVIRATVVATSISVTGDDRRLGRPPASDALKGKRSTGISGDREVMAA